MRVPSARRLADVEAPIRDVLGPARELERKGERILKLNIGDPCKYDFRPPQPLADALRRHAGEGAYGDSEGAPVARQAIATWEREARGIRVEADDVVLTLGVSEGLMMVFGALLDPGDEVLIPGPSYPQYIGVARFYGATPVEYPSGPDTGWVPRVEDVVSRITPRTKAVCLISPNNPTGSVWPPDVVRGIAKAAQERGLAVVSDDIYSELVFDGKASSAATETTGPVIILNGFSKSWLVPGWRLGYVAFRHAGELADVREGVLKLARSRLSANLPMQLAIADVLEAKPPHLEDVRRRLRERRDLTRKLVAECPDLSLSAPDGAFYAFVGIRNNPFPTDKEWVLRLLHEEKVLAVHGSGFGASGKGHFRIVILPEPETLAEALTRAGKFATRVARR